MAIPDADIPPALQGELSMIIVPSGHSWNILKYPLGTAFDDPRLQSLPASLEIHGLSDAAAESIADLLSMREPTPSAQLRAELLRSALSNST